jgi:hypothetical protein
VAEAEAPYAAETGKTEPGKAMADMDLEAEI